MQLGEAKAFLKSEFIIDGFGNTKNLLRATYAPQRTGGCEVSSWLKLQVAPCHLCQILFVPTGDLDYRR